MLPTPAKMQKTPNIDCRCIRIIYPISNGGFLGQVRRNLHRTFSIVKPSFQSRKNTKDARGTWPSLGFANDKSLKGEHAPALVQIPSLMRFQKLQLRLYFVPYRGALR